MDKRSTLSCTIESNNSFLLLTNTHIKTDIRHKGRLTSTEILLGEKYVCVFGELKDNDSEEGFLLHFCHILLSSHRIDYVIKLSTFNLPGEDLTLSWG